MSKIIYFGQYSTASGARQVSVAANTLMDYVIKAISSVEQNVTVVSYAQKRGAREAELEKGENGFKILYLPLCLSDSDTKVGKWLASRKNKKIMLKALGKIIDNGDTVISYHSLGCIDLLKKLRKKKSFTLALQVAEIYSDVDGTERQREKELAFIRSADKYIFSSVPLNELINKEGKPYAICMGTYKAEKQLAEPKNDGKHHIVYAGTFNPIKGGVFNAIDAAEYLDEKYHLHLLGAGEERLFKLVIKRMLQTSAKTSCEITYDGYLQGEEYLKFLQSCHVGLSTQSAQGAFSDTSFPSKVLVYLANGLRVVSGDVLPLKKSALNDAIFYYDGSDPEQIAKAIKRACGEDAQNGRELLNKLDSDLKASIAELIKA